MSIQIWKDNCTAIGCNSICHNSHIFKSIPRMKRPICGGNSFEITVLWTFGDKWALVATMVWFHNWRLTVTLTNDDKTHHRIWTSISHKEIIIYLIRHISNSIHESTGRSVVLKLVSKYTCTFKRLLVESSYWDIWLHGKTMAENLWTQLTSKQFSYNWCFDKKSSKLELNLLQHNVSIFSWALRFLYLLL